MIVKHNGKALTSIFFVIGMLLSLSACLGADKKSGYGSAEIRDDGISIAVLTETSGASEVKFIKVTGLADKDVEQALNDELFTFSVWGVGEQYETEKVTEVLSIDYAVIGDVLSVRRNDKVLWQGAETPARYMRTQIFDLTTGAQAGSLSDYISVDEKLRELITSGAFEQVYPGEIAGAKEALAVEIVDKYNPDFFDLRFYLTETAFGLYIDGEVEGGKGYWAFEAPYEKVAPLMKAKLPMAESK